MRKRIAVASGTLLLAGGIAAAIVLRPSPTGRDVLEEPEHIPPAAREILRRRMERHGAEMRELVMRVILIDDDAAARIAGEIYDEPTLARPLGRDELNGMLPDRFFVLQDDLKARSRSLVAALARHDRRVIADDFAALTRGCLACHDAYLHERPTHADNAR